MSGLSLRALLEGSHLSLDLKLNGSAASPASSQESQPKALSPTLAAYDASRAYLNRTSIWDVPEADGSIGVDGGFNLEYMDLEEFLQETGLETLDRAAIFPASPAASVASSSAGSNASCDAPVASAKPTASRVTPTTDAVQQQQQQAAAAAATAVALPPSRPSSPAESCDMSTAESVDGSVTVADVPGKEGFDPESHKFAPEELVPQPIIKKSRKVYVPDDLKDERYWTRRKKNNYAAKRSRDARRAKENQIIMRAAFLEQHNDELSAENKRLLDENKTLTALVQAYKQRLGDK